MTRKSLKVVSRPPLVFVLALSSHSLLEYILYVFCCIAVEVVSQTKSLICPISQKRLVHPVRGSKCDEHQPFERIAFEEYSKIVERSNSKKRNASKNNSIACPVCGKPITGLVVCRETVALLGSTGSNVDSVSIGTNGEINNGQDHAQEDRNVLVIDDGACGC